MGSVGVGEFSRHEFAAAPSVSQPLPGAHVRVRVAYDSSETCGTAEAAANPRAPSNDVTGSDGQYDVELAFGALVFSPDKHVLVCVDHPEYGSYEYRTIYERTTDPRWGEKFLNIYIGTRGSRPPGSQ
jgi:hypothetical protein